MGSTTETRWDEVSAVEQKHALVLLGFAKEDAQTDDCQLTDAEWAWVRRRFDKCSSHITEQCLTLLGDLADDAKNAKLDD